MLAFAVRLSPSYATVFPLPSSSWASTLFFGVLSRKTNQVNTSLMPMIDLIQTKKPTWALRTTFQRKAGPLPRLAGLNGILSGGRKMGNAHKHFLACVH
jgi:hypothetical protein